MLKLDQAGRRVIKKPPCFPRSERDARAKTRRKMKALKSRAQDLMWEAASYWDEGIVSGSIDILLNDMEANLAGIEDAMQEQMEITADRESSGG